MSNHTPRPFINPTEFGIWLNHTRIKKRLTYRKFAPQCGMQPSRLADIENGTVEANPILMTAIWMALTKEGTINVE